MRHALIHVEDISLDDTVTIDYASVSFFDRRKYGFPQVGDEMSLQLEDPEFDFSILGIVTKIDEATQRILIQLQTGHDE